MKRFLTIMIAAATLLSCNNDAADSPKPEEDPKIHEGFNDDPSWKPDREAITFHDGKFWQNEKWHFIKAGKPLVNYATEEGCDEIRANLSKYKEFGYNALELNCYWHHFETDGDGVIDVSMAPLKALVHDIYEAGLFPCITVETYSVGGGSMPEKFFETYPEAVAIDEQGEPVMDEEYGFNTAVVSIFHEQYRENVHKYIRNLCLGLGDELKKVLWFETTVEPQYGGGVTKICYSENARKEYDKWRKENGYTTDATKMPETFPIKDSFVQNSVWNKFRAQFLAKWVNEDAQAFKDVYKEVTGMEGYVAADYLDADEPQQYVRDGDPQEFLNCLTVPDIIQINWTMNYATWAFNEKAYNRVRNAMTVNGRSDWAISEHMTWQAEFLQQGKVRTKQHIQDLFKNGTRCCMDFPNCKTSDTDGFCLYTTTWRSKMPIIDDDWDDWMQYAWELENK